MWLFIHTFLFTARGRKEAERAEEDSLIQRNGGIKVVGGFLLEFTSIPKGRDIRTTLPLLLGFIILSLTFMKTQLQIT